MDKCNRTLKADVLRRAEFDGPTVHQLFAPTPLERSTCFGTQVYFKREDVSPVHSFKWRGAFLALSEASARGVRQVVAASAGNHAQGVAAAARHFKLQAVIFMPVSTPEVKVESVRELGGEAVRVELMGSSYDDAAEAASHYAAAQKLPLIHAFDDPAVIAGSATIAQEVEHSLSGQRLDVAYLQVGGGGLAAGMGLWLRKIYPEIHLVGVEAEDQACMRAALRADALVTLPSADRFCDGTSVRRAGRLTFDLCRDLFNEMLTVSNEEVCQGMEALWASKRLIAEPAGALGFAGFLTQRYHHQGQRVLVVISGANMDFQKIGIVSARRRSHRDAYFGEMLHV